MVFTTDGMCCWTYSHHCQIADMKPSKGSWNGEFRGFRICVGWISTTRFCVSGFLCARLVSFYSVSILCLFSLFSGYHAAGYHAPSIPHGLPRLYHHCTATTPVYIYPGYHAIVLCSIPKLSHLSYHAPPHTYIG